MTLQMSQLNEYFKACCEFDTHKRYRSRFSLYPFNSLRKKKVGKSTTYEQYQYINETKTNKTDRNVLGRLLVPQAMCIKCEKKNIWFFFCHLCCLKFIANYMSVKIRNMFRKSSMVSVNYEIIELLSEVNTEHHWG